MPPVKDTDRIRQKLDIATLLRSYLTLIPAGKNYKAICPFHQEKTPSFIVSPDRQTWHCFGSCGEGGDIFSFVMKYENLEFPEALRFLAEKAGVQISSVSSREEREFAALYDIHDLATSFYAGKLADNPEALAYLTSRGLTPETIREFRIGYAPTSPAGKQGSEELVLYLLREKFDINDLVRSGLAYKNRIGLYRDRFEGRIMFPISNAVGKLVAFSGRILVDNPDEPKYINSPETPVFNKSRVLYGFHEAKMDIAREKTVVIVEGQMDLLMARQDGVKNAVAVSGTGFTTQHLERLRRIADTIVVSFDNDDAGVKALERSLDAASGFDFHVKALSLGAYKDPAEAVRADPGFLARAVRDAAPAFSHLFRLYFGTADRSGDLAVRKRVIQHLLGHIRKVRSGVERSEWLRELAVRSGTTENTLLAEMAALPDERKDASKEREVVVPPKAPEAEQERGDRIARRILAIAFTHPNFWATIQPYREHFPKSFQGMVANPEGSNAMIEMYASYLVGAGDEKSFGAELTSLLIQLRTESLKKQRVELNQALRKSQERGDEAAAQEVMERLQKVGQELNNLTLS